MQFRTVMMRTYSLFVLYARVPRHLLADQYLGVATFGDLDECFRVLQVISMNYHAYKIAIGYFTLFLMASLFSSLVMFIQKTGMDYERTFMYYSDKSVEGLMELAHPHLGGDGTVSDGLRPSLYLYISAKASTVVDGSDVSGRFYKYCHAIYGLGRL